MLSNDEKGFTMVEMIVSVLLLAVAILALSTTTAGLVRVSVDAQGKALALQACEDRIAQVKLHPIYTQLDSIYTESATGVMGMEGYTRVTDVQRVITPGSPQGKFVDYTRITVTVVGPGLEAPISRTVTIGAS